MQFNDRALLGLIPSTIKEGGRWRESKRKRRKTRKKKREKKRGKKEEKNESHYEPQIRYVQSGSFSELNYRIIFMLQGKRPYQK